MPESMCKARNSLSSFPSPLLFPENSLRCCGQVAYLIVDPHYTGKDDDLKSILSKGWVGWKSLGSDAKLEKPGFGIPHIFTILYNAHIRKRLHQLAIFVGD